MPEASWLHTLHAVDHWGLSECDSIFLILSGLTGTRCLYLCCPWAALHGAPELHLAQLSIGGDVSLSAGVSYFLYMDDFVMSLCSDGFRHDPLVPPGQRWPL